MKLEEKIKIHKDYFESLGMEVNYADSVIVSCRDDDGIHRNKETGAITFEVQYETCYYNYLNKTWKKDISVLSIEILANNLWLIETVTVDENVLLGYFTEEVAKTILENLVKRKTLEG